MPRSLRRQQDVPSLKRDSPVAVNLGGVEGPRFIVGLSWLLSIARGPSGDVMNE